ncbi:MAG: DUF2130 domain-containing protein [Coriobacteriaceae bacterium]|nr:DUF2130 domain-containing protein [Coriobacteriaceae bacterium]
MAEIKCPKCGTLISLEQSDLDSIVHQVRDEQFEKEISERTALLEADKARAVELAQTQAEAKLQKRMGAKDAIIAELQTQAKAAEAEAKAREGEIAAKAQAELAQAAAAKDAEIEALKAQLAAQRDTLQAKHELAVTQAVAAIEKERDALTASIERKEAEKARAEAAFKEQLAEQAKAKDDIIAFQKDEIERMKDMKARLSTKMVGETLEQHCQYEFDRIRAIAFPNAYFEKDNEAVEGTKGDFVFREEDEDGNEIISIMFEMKNETDSTSTKKKNEDHFAKLDKDRAKKGCEYAILVSLLEPDNELYNEGIVDVSHRYPKMYVVRPQFFIPIISLLRNAALSSLEYKRELALVRQQELDITHFEEDLDVFKQGFFKNFGDASLRFEEAVKAIDKAIADLQKAKDKLLVSEKHLSAANNKLEGLTVKKLTRKNPTMKAKFKALEEARDEDED